MTSEITIQAVGPGGRRSKPSTFRGTFGAPRAAAVTMAEHHNPGWEAREVRHLPGGTYEVRMKQKRKEATS